ncbi:deoxynucleotidyltransferase terminal-interacting protein 2 isoform X2 [Rousettus aegyptiacus]|uniref:Deoxynucleotidyltransferase terminal interacting protein 2 n=1 Tax=Rousettus aegyptiacus TaxID=9407 RepID=A0A7J8K7A8_ROUAE|nr:deoxynucleotidyltransferase terminal-interacting protein 2 isoform X2 [Rousettus aegyptiacus]KAF6504728.1 deoxynucleotidyltransferase terminal interacting protein 2 [Rousettus aegyptiacus]
MVVTRSARPQASIQATSAENSGQKNSAKRIQACLKGRKESPSDDSRIAESQSTKKQSPIPRTPKTGKRKSRTTGSLPKMNKLSTDGETSEAESSSSVSELQDPILRVTRRRKILVACTPVSSVRKKLKITPINESHTEEEVSEAESHVSGISRIVPSTVVTTRTRRIKAKAKSLTDPSQESHAEAVSDAESSCSDISTFSGFVTRRTTRSMQRKLQAVTEEKDTKIIPENEKPMINIPMNSDTRQTSPYIQARFLSQINEPDFSNNEICNDFDDDSFHGNSEKKLIVQKGQHFNIQEEKQVSVAPLKEIKQNHKSLTEEAEGVIDEGKEINEKNSELTSLSEHQDTSLQQLVSQRHSTPQSNKTTSKPSNMNCEAIMKSLAQTFAVVEIDRWTEERKSTMKTSYLKSSDGGGSDEECTVIAVSDNMNKEKNVDFECDAKIYKSELTKSQDAGDSILLLSSSDESQQSENSEIEEDTLCFVENSGQNESLNGDSENMLSDNALFVIDTTPGLNADKNFYLDEEDKASEVAIEEEKEEEDEKSEEEPSDHDKNEDDEFSDEDDLLNSTKSKLLKLTSSSIDPGLSIKQLGGLYINFNADKLHSNKKTLTQIQEKKKNEFLQKAVITPDFEKKDCVPPYRESKYQLQKKRRKERQKTAGDGWFGMKAPELTDELKNDLKALKMRASMDPKRFYKKNDRDGFPKYFQIGTIVDNPADFYHSRIPKKQRKKTIVEELLADSEFRRYNRRKYSEIMAEKAANAAGKKFRKKKKFRN